MFKYFTKIMKYQSSSVFKYQQFTHYIARAILEDDIEKEIRHLFSFLDRQSNGCIFAGDLFSFLKELHHTQRFHEDDIDHIF